MTPGDDYDIALLSPVLRTQTRITTFVANYALELKERILLRP